MRANIPRTFGALAGRQTAWCTQNMFSRHFGAAVLEVFVHIERKCSRDSECVNRNVNRTKAAVFVKNPCIREWFDLQ